MRINLRKIVQNIREAWQKGGDAAVSGRGGKSSAYSWAQQVGREYLPDATWDQVIKIAKGEATLRWQDGKVEFVETPAQPAITFNDASAPATSRLHQTDEPDVFTIGPDQQVKFERPEPVDPAPEIMIRIVFKDAGDPIHSDYLNADMHLARLECSASVDRDGLAAMLKGMDVPGRGTIIAVESYATMRLWQDAPLGLLIRRKP